MLGRLSGKRRGFLALLVLALFCSCGWSFQDFKIGLSKAQLPGSALLKNCIDHSKSGIILSGLRVPMVGRKTAIDACQPSGHFLTSGLGIPHAAARSPTATTCRACTVTTRLSFHKDRFYQHSGGGSFLMQEGLSERKINRKRRNWASGSYYVSRQVLLIS